MPIPPFLKVHCAADVFFGLITYDFGMINDIKWSIIARAPSYKKGNRQCDLCLTEKLHIANTFNNPAFLNKRSELALRCRHRTKFLLSPPTEGEEE